MAKPRNLGRSFVLNNALFASVWLIFLIPSLVAMYFAPGFGTVDQIGATTCVLAFGGFYFFAFGSIGYYPRGWRPEQRAALRWIVLASIAALSIPFLGILATTFVPYLAALLGFNLSLPPL